MCTHWPVGGHHDVRLGQILHAVALQLGAGGDGEHLQALACEPRERILVT